MKVCIDYGKCQGHTMCHLVSPEVFDVSAQDGKGLVRFAEVPPDLHEAARRAQESCPEEAIIVTE
jgi:ferredoxin